jgi:hypothetical protein
LTAAPMRRMTSRAARTARRGSHPSTAAADLARTILSWEGVTARRGEARLGRETLGRLPGHVRAGELERVLDAFRDRYDSAADDVDRRAGVRG